MIGSQIQEAIVTALKTAPAVVGGRVYDRVPENETFPYITVGDEQVIDDGNSCGDGWEVFPDVHIWSRRVGFGEMKSLLASVVSRVRSISSVGGFTLKEVKLDTSRSFRDPDGITSHGVATFRFLVDQA